MATILPFVVDKSRKDIGKAPGEPAQVLMFTGVRYERTRETPERRRDAIGPKDGPRRNSR